jgi:hypothetical protein
MRLEQCLDINMTNNATTGNNRGADIYAVAINNVRESR